MPRRKSNPTIPAPTPAYHIALGDRVRVRTTALRTDGLTDTQEFEAVVTFVDPWRFEYRVDRRIFSENVLRPVEEGGFTRTIPLEKMHSLVQIIPAVAVIQE